MFPLYISTQKWKEGHKNVFIYLVQYQLDEFWLFKVKIFDRWDQDHGYKTGQEL